MPAKLNIKRNMPILSRVNGLEKMRIDSFGNVGIGTTSPSGPFFAEEEPLTKWYKAGVEKTGLTPHTKEEHGT